MSARSRVAVGVAAAAALVLGVGALVAQVRPVPGAEEALFDAVNGGPAPPYALVWAPMQLGTLAAVVGLATLALLLGRRLLAASLAVAGLAAWLLVPVVKDAVGRPRPARLLDSVHLRHAPDEGPGFPSAHTTVATALAVAAWPHLGRRARVVAVVLACVVGLARVHIGAHLPLDVLGGIALGVLVAAVVHAVAGLAARARPVSHTGGP